MSDLNSGLGINLDGIIGYEILSKQKSLLSYKNKELKFFVCKQMREDEL